LAFQDAVKQKNGPPIPYEQLIGVSEAAFAAVESLRTGQSVKITINE